MGKEKCINHVSDTYMAILRGDYYILCENDNCSAMILNQFENWMNVKITNKTKADYEKIVAEKSELQPTQNNSLWVWKTQAQLKEELYNLFGINKIRKSLAYLVDNDYIFRRRNPKYNWDKTYQYMINVNKVQRKLDEIAKAMKEEKEKIVVEEELNNEDSNMNNGNSNIEYTEKEIQSIKEGDSKLSNCGIQKLNNNDLVTPNRGSNTIDNYIDNNIENNNIDNNLDKEASEDFSLFNIGTEEEEIEDFTEDKINNNTVEKEFVKYEIDNNIPVEEKDLTVEESKEINIPVEKKEVYTYLEILEYLFKELYKETFQEEYILTDEEIKLLKALNIFNEFETNKKFIISFFDNWNEIATDKEIKELPTVKLLRELSDYVIGKYVYKVLPRKKKVS